MMRIISQKYGPLSLSPIDANSVSGVLLPGSTVLFNKSDFGSIMIQQLPAEHYTLRYCIFNFVRRTVLFFEEESASLRSRLILKGNIGIRVGKQEKINLRESQFKLYDSSDNTQAVYFENGKEYRLFDSGFSYDLLKPLLTAFPSLQTYLSSTYSSKETSLLKKPRFATPEMIRIVNDLLKAPYDENLQKIYFENKVNDYLFEILAQTYKPPPLGISLTAAENEAIFAASELVLKDISKHITIKEISKLVQLNEFKLKRGFKQIFKMGLFEYLLKARMEKARELLLETEKPIKEIASITGFEFLTNFIAAFRKHFGYTPGELRRK
jgi:AraC family transcriptional activator of pyochelin receptor